MADDYLLIKALLGLAENQKDPETKLHLWFDASILHEDRVRELQIARPRGAYVRDYGNKVEKDY